MGDGTLGSFKTISDAIYCAGELIQICEAISIKLRIGIHFGEVVEEHGDIFGDGVNVASRLEPLAKPGHILVSEPVHQNIKNKPGIESTFIEEAQLKHVKEPVKLYEVNVSRTPVLSDDTLIPEKPKRTALILGATVLVLAIIVFMYFMKMNSFGDVKEVNDTIEEDEKSIAVIPFVNMSNDPDQEFFCDGISEEIINALAQIQGLNVAGRTSSFQFKGDKVDLREIGKKLGVGNILEGSIQISGNRIRITVQLINVDDGFHLWSARFDRELEDIFAIQDEISAAIAEKLKVTLLATQRNEQGTKNVKA